MKFYTYEEKVRIANNIRNSVKDKPMTEYQQNYINQVTIEECELETRQGKTKYYQIQGQNRKENSPLVIMVHGGGFCKGYSEADRAFAAMIAVETNTLILDIDYKLAPEYPFPAAFEEVYDVTKWAYENEDKLGIDKSKIVLCGSSAGGNLVVATAMEAVKTKEFEIKLQILNYPALDLYTDPEEKAQGIKSYIPFEQSRQYNSLYILSIEESENPYVSLIFAKEDMLKGMPDSLFITGGLDVLHAEAEKFAYKMIEAGSKVTVKRFLNSDHAFTVRCTGEWLEAHRLIVETINNI
ncbi:acetyl esterase [Clostridium sp. DSM 8431]|uniref:alpha/beta hydrolase n=1 Tax=Clostridium sp. DSM 8431 TaxID=1761781 RepID=UPI0008F44404|nr:alpha/beta hydrolase [Clostridium sp. DSM 8431]SFU76041.1 acetyl esterase [Clostridium sp. DSM 8431]